MKFTFKKLIPLFLALVLLFAVSLPVLADTAAPETAAEESAETASPDNSKTGKAVAAAIAVGIAAAAGAVSMGLSISKSAESIARQPEAAGNIRTSLMLGLVFIETAIIYALIVGILIIFVL